MDRKPLKVEEEAALAQYCHAKAAAARKAAEEHVAMGKSYGGTKFPDAVAMREHCEKLAKQHEAMAK